MAFRTVTQVINLDSSGEGETTFSVGSRKRPARVVLCAISASLEKAGGSEDGDVANGSPHNVDYSFDSDVTGNQYNNDTGVASLDDTDFAADSTGSTVLRESVTCSLTGDKHGPAASFRRVTLVLEV